MNTLIQQESMLVGSLEAILELENKHFAKLLVLSDSHGNSEILEDIILQFGHDCDALLFCGDGDYDVITLLENAQTNEKLCTALPSVLACVRGNGDTEQYHLQKQDSEPVFLPVILSDRLFFKVASRTIMLVHGHNHSVDLGTETLALSAKTHDADLIFFGHTHRPLREEIHGTLIVNPGSCSRPRDNFPPSFAIVSYPGVTERFIVEFIQIEEKAFGNNDYSILSIV